MNASPYATRTFREATGTLKSYNFPITTVCRFCNKTETRGCMRNGRCRACNKGQS